MKFLVIGGGSIGKRHTRNLLAVGIKPEDIGVVEVRDDRIEEIKSTIGIQNVYTSLDQAVAAKTYNAALLFARQLRYTSQWEHNWPNAAYIF